MIINMRERATDEEIKYIIDRVKEAGYEARNRTDDGDCRWRPRTMP
jgi:hypothetical protein